MHACISACMIMIHKIIVVCCDEYNVMSSKHNNYYSYYG